MLQLATVRVNAKHLHMLCHAEWNSVVAIAFFLNFFITCVKTTLDISYAGCVLCYSVQICHVMCSLENPSVSTLFTCLPLHVLSVLSYAPKMCSPLWQCWEGAWGFVHVPQSLALICFKGYCSSHSTTCEEQDGAGDCSTSVKRCAHSGSGCTGLLLFWNSWYACMLCRPGTEAYGQWVLEKKKRKKNNVSWQRHTAAFLRVS